MQALFVHGMGRTPLSGWRMLRRLRAHGVQTHAFAYFTSLHDFAAIRSRLAARLRALAADGDYVVIGHSLGGVLLRAALAELPGDAKPRRLFLLGSPVAASRIAHRLRRTWPFRVLAGDCGQLLGSAARMADIGPSDVPTTAIVGDRGWRGRLSPFGDAPNDLLVAVAEAHADWADEEIRVPVAHTWLPSDARVSRHIVERLGAVSTCP